MTPFTCVVIGNESLLIGCAEAALARGHSIAAVVSTDADIQAWAAAQALPCHADPVEIEVAFDWLFSIANLRVIPEAVLGRAGRGAINFHDGPLPAYAGLNTPNWALIRGETRHGITWHMLEGGIDEGDIIAQRLFDIAADDTAYSLNSKCYAAALESFSEVLDQVESGTPERQPQDLSQRSYFAKADRPAAGARLDFNRRAADIARLVRALDFGGYWNPLCAPKLATLTGQLVLVGTARAEATAEDGAQNHPGQVLGVSKTEVQIATADGVLVLSDLRLPMGGKVTPAQYFATGDALPLLTEDEAEALTAALAATQAAEPHWRQVLTDLQPVQVPLARAEASGNMVPLSINVPATLSEPDQLVAVLAWALLSDGADKVDLAVTTPELAAAAIPGLIADWAPLGLNRTARLSEVRYQLADWQDRIRRRGGFACDLPARDPQISRIDMPRIGLSIGQQSPLPGCLITVAVCEGTLTLHVDEAALSETARDLLAARLQHLLTQVAAAGDLALQDIDALPQTEKQLLLTSWNTTAREYHKGLTIPAAFEAQVARTPEVTALVFEDQSYSYSALNARANAVADRLHDMGVTRGSTVGVYVRRSPDLVVATLAIMKAGGAYVPMDPAYPADRIAHYLQDSQAHVVITQSDLKPGLPTSDAAVLVLDGMVPAEVSRPNVDCGIGASDLAYLIYTSGSTGTPKGVMVSHGNVANFFAGMDDRIPHHVGDTWLAVTSLSFDISVLELFWTLSRGFKLVLSSDESRLQLSNGPIAMSDRRMDFNLFYWGNDDGPGPRKYHLLLEGAKFADANGFNAVWTPERHFHAFGGPYPNPSVTGAAVAAVTNNLSVRAGSCVAPLHHPARVAEEWSVIDNLTNGRAGIGIASGWQPDDFILRPENTPPANKPAMYETIDILRRLWRGEEVEFPRQDGTPHAVITQPRPVSRELPVWVTTAGNPDTWREAGEIGANVLTHLLGQSIAEVGDKIRIYRDALRGAGHDPDKFTVTLMLHTYLADSREEARRIAREPMKDYLRSAAGLIKQYAWAFPAFKRPKGVNNPFEMQLDILSPEELEAILDFAFERYFEDSGLFGTVQDGVKRTEELKRIGVDEIACLIDYGIAPDVVLKGLEPLAEVLRLSNAPTELAKDDFSLAAQMVRHQVSHMQCTPSMARMISQNEEALMAVGRLQHLLVGGEALPGDLVAALRAGSTAQIHNMYGPTETTIWSTVQTLDGIPQGIADIGTPIANTTVYVLDTSGRPAPVGVAGELFIGGEGVAAGYWRRPELTAERFVADPHGTDSARMYRTGDLARWRSDGRLDFLGRTDHQVKIRGQRIELGEIEAAVAAYPGVTAAVVVPRMVGAVEQLVAYVTATDAVDDAAVKDHLSRRLAEVMVPAHVVRLEQFPLTPNKKIDRKALPDPTPARAATTPASQPPAGGVQTRIAAVWSRILGIEGIAAQDNFFALGGHSLLAVQAHRDIRQDIGVTQLSITDIFRFPTLSGLADHIEGLTGSSDAETAAPPAPEDTAARTDRMSKRREMRANRKARTG